MTRYVVNPGASAVTVEARSTLHDIRRSGPVTGEVEMTLDGDTLDLAAAVAGRLELNVEDLRGDSYLDREIAHRLDSARFPTVTAELQHAASDGAPGCYRMSGSLSFHGRSQTVAGEARVSCPDPETLELRGSMTIDVRDFGIDAPRLLLLKVDPMVDVSLRLTASTRELSPRS